jgi:hypothetical protein
VHQVLFIYLERATITLRGKGDEDGNGIMRINKEKKEGKIKTHSCL